MSDKFKAIVLNQSGGQFSREVKTLDKSFLKTGDVLIKIDYSDLNFKDAMILKNGGKLIKEFPRIPGIDFSGTVEESNVDEFIKGDQVILTGSRVGELYHGGYSQFAKVKKDFIIKKPEGVNTKQAMMLGTAGFTAILCAFAVKAKEELLLGEKVKEVLVTGSTGGVGSVAVMALSVKHKVTKTSFTFSPNNNSSLALTANAQSIAVNPAVPNIIACFVLTPSGFFMMKSFLTLANCE
jgi:alcohol dehydrogenase/acrylyl-CoA reductase (NADPH)